MNDVPIPPEDKSKHPKGYIPTKPEDDPDWIEYWYYYIICINVIQSFDKISTMLHLNIESNITYNDISLNPIVSLKLGLFVAAYQVTDMNG